MYSSKFVRLFHCQSFTLYGKLLEIESVEGIEEIWSTIKEAILGGSQKFIPKRKSKGSTLPVWCNGEIKHQSNCLRTLRKNIC